MIHACTTHTCLLDLLLVPFSHNTHIRFNRREIVHASDADNFPLMHAIRHNGFVEKVP